MNCMIYGSSSHLLWFGTSPPCRMRAWHEEFKSFPGRFWRTCVTFRTHPGKKQDTCFNLFRGFALITSEQGWQSKTRSQRLMAHMRYFRFTQSELTFLVTILSMRRVQVWVQRWALIGWERVNDGYNDGYEDASLAGRVTRSHTHPQPSPGSGWLRAQDGCENAKSLKSLFLIAISHLRMNYRCAKSYEPFKILPPYIYYRTPITKTYPALNFSTSNVKKDRSWYTEDRHLPLELSTKSKMCLLLGSWVRSK